MLTSVDQITRQHVRHSHPDLDAAKIERIEAVAREWQRLVRWQVQQLRPAERIAEASRPRLVVKAFRASPERAQFATLNSHLQQEAIAHACAIVAGGWEQAAERIRSRIARRRSAGKISEAEAHELNWLLRWPTHLAEILGGGIVVPNERKFADNDHWKLDRWLRTALLRERPGQPRLGHALWFSADAMTSRASERAGGRFPAWISLPTLEKGRPVRVPLAGAGIAHLAEGKTLRVSIERDRLGRRRVALRYALLLDPVVRTGTLVAGADKGITTVLTLTESDHEHATSHGSTYGKALTDVASRLVRRNRGRIHALARSLETSDAQKTARIRAHNLGQNKRERRRAQAEARLRQLHNLAIKDAFRSHPEVATLALEDLGFVSTTDRGSRENRRLARWAKGQLQRDLERLSEANGVGLKVVNAAYSSQACPTCSWTERANRSGPAFRCRRCGTAGSSDAVAASNLRTRASDPEITRFMSLVLVKQVLLRRAAERAEALGLHLEPEDHGAAPGMTTIRHDTESPVPNAA